MAEEGGQPCDEMVKALMNEGRSGDGVPSLGRLGASIRKRKDGSWRAYGLDSSGGRRRLGTFRTEAEVRGAVAGLDGGLGSGRSTYDGMNY